MELTHNFTVAAPVDQAWQVLLDLERIAPCMPGATLTSVEGDEFTGTVRVKLGPVTMTFRGQGRFVERDAQAHRIVVEASGKERSGGGSARVSIRATLRPDGDGHTAVEVHSDLSVTGRAGQLGRGMIAEVSNRLLGQFTECLADQLADQLAGPAEPASPPAAHGAADQTAAAADQTAADRTAADQQPAPAATQLREAEPVDLLAVTGIRAAVLRFVPYLLAFVLGGLAGAGLAAWLG